MVHSSHVHESNVEASGMTPQAPMKTNSMDANYEYMRKRCYLDGHGIDTACTEVLYSADHSYGTQGSVIEVVAEVKSSILMSEKLLGEASILHPYVKRTLCLLETGADKGVPSRLSAGLFFDMVSSRNGRTFKSAYLRQLIPQLSHSTPVASPFGAFHHWSDSRVRQAPQLLSCLVSSATIDPSSSEVSRGTGGATGFPAARNALIRSFSSPSFAL